MMSNNLEFIEREHESFSRLSGRKKTVNVNQQNPNLDLLDEAKEDMFFDEITVVLDHRPEQLNTIQSATKSGVSAQVNKSQVS